MPRKSPRASDEWSNYADVAEGFSATTVV
jgi:hypothetical protein